jgi:aryl-alcohol dehydrogenase-like predicted oxidoreductase
MAMTNENWRTSVVLGKTGIRVSRLGIGSSYGVPTKAILRAFDRGINYLYWGTYRTEEMGRAIRQLAPHHRDEIVVVLQTYSRAAWLIPKTFHSGLRRLGIEHADVLLLGMYNRVPPERIMSAAAALQRSGLVRHLDNCS